MKGYRKHPRLKRNTEPIDAAVWHWFVCNGPHGEQFCWHKDSPVVSRDIELLRKFISERDCYDPTFSEKARIIALEAIENTDPVLVCTGIQVLAVVGKESDFESLETFIEHPNEMISMNAKCCLFEVGIKIKKT